MIIASKKGLVAFITCASFISGTSNADIFAISPNDSSSEIQIFNLGNDAIEQVDTYIFNGSVVDFDFNSQTGDLFALTTTGLWKRDSYGNTDRINSINVDETSYADIAISPDGSIAVSPNDYSLDVYIFDSDGNDRGVIDFSSLTGCPPLGCPRPIGVGGISYDPTSGDLFGISDYVLFKSSPSGDLTMVIPGNTVGGQYTEDRDITISNHGVIAHTEDNTTPWVYRRNLNGGLLSRTIFGYGGTIEDLTYYLANNDLYAWTTDGVWRKDSNNNDDLISDYNAQATSGGDIAFLITDLHFTGNGADWAEKDNWTANLTPANPHSVFIDSENGGVVFGPMTNTTIKSLTIGSLIGDTNELKMVEGGELTVINGVSILPNGILTGSDSIHADISNSGIVSPGDSPGLLEIDGDYTQDIDGELIIEIAGLESTTGFDSLQVNGTANLAGTLTIELLNFTPSLGDTFDIFSAETLIGAFNTIVLPALDDGTIFDVAYLPDETGSTDIIRLSAVSSVPAATWLQVTGTAQGGSIFFTVAGVGLSVTTTNSLSTEQVIQAMTDAVNDNATLSAIGVTALAVGDTLYINNVLTNIRVTDPGLILTNGFGEPPPSDGDINLDGMVNVADILIGMQVLNDAATLSPEQFIHGDVAPLVEGLPDPDGKFTLGDLLIIERKVLGVISF